MDGRRARQHLKRIARTTAPLLAALALALATTVAAQPHGRPSGTAALQRELAGIVAASEVPGAAVALAWADGGTWSAGFGVADVEAGTPVSSGTLFRANSVSKSFVALALLRLHEQGRLPIDARLRDVAPEIAFTNRWEATHPVRVAHLLEHTTGFDALHLRDYLRAGDGTLGGALAANPAPRTARWPPGTRMAYNDGAYAVAAYLVEKAAGERFEAYVEREILRPLGMHGSGFGLERVDRSRLTTHHLTATQTEPAAPYPPIIRPAGALIASADDLAAFVHLLLRRGEPLLSGAALARMETPGSTAAARAGVRVGYGLGSYTSGGAGHLWHGHAGGTPSAYARYAYQPRLGVGYVILLNGADAKARRRMEAAIQRFLVAGRAPPPPAATPDGAGELAAYTGAFRQGTSSWQVTAGLEGMMDVQRVRAQGGTLIVAPLLGDLPRVLLPAGGDRFRGEGEAEPSAVFLRDARGRVAALRTWDADNVRAGNYERVSPLVAYGSPVVFALSLLLMASGLAVALFRGAAALLGRPAPEGERLVRWLPIAAVLSLVAALVVLVAGVAGRDAVEVLGRATFASVGFWALAWAFALLSLAAVLVTGRALARRPDIRRAVRIHSFLVALACTTLALYLTSWGIIGLRTWA